MPCPCAARHGASCCCRVAALKKMVVQMGEGVRASATTWHTLQIVLRGLLTPDAAPNDFPGFWLPNAQRARFSLCCWFSHTLELTHQEEGADRRCSANAADVWLAGDSNRIGSALDEATQWTVQSQVVLAEAEAAASGLVAIHAENLQLALLGASESSFEIDLRSQAVRGACQTA